MAKKLIDIRFIKNEKDNFLNYLDFHLDEEVKRFIADALKIAEVYVFSGVIRNYFLKIKTEIRDLDLVFKSDDLNSLDSLFQKYKYKKNSFGGYKIIVGKLNIDFWNIDKTWALNKDTLFLDLDKEYFLPQTSFFNFSAIIFDLNKNEFIPSQHFIHFLQNLELDYVLEENPQPILCMVNTLYYSSKYNLKISKRLKKYFVKYFNQFTRNEFDSVQIKHFNEVIYSYEYLKVYFKIFNENQRITTK